ARPLPTMSDAGSGADSASLAVTAASSDIGTDSEMVTTAAKLSVADQNGSISEIGQTKNVRVVADSGTAAEAVRVGIVSKDSGHGADSAIFDLHPLVTADRNGAVTEFAFIRRHAQAGDVPSIIAVDGVDPGDLSAVNGLDDGEVTAVQISPIG